MPEQVSKQSPRVVCISRALGAGGEVVGRTVAEELGFAYVDEEIVQRAAALVDVPIDLVANAEERKSLAGRILRELAGGMAGASIFVGGMQPPEALSASDDYRELIQQAIHETAERGSVVIVAHAASFALAGKSEVLRVLITGSPAPRRQRLTEEGLSETEAAKLVERGDQGESRLPQALLRGQGRAARALRPRREHGRASARRRREARGGRRQGPGVRRLWTAIVIAPMLAD